MEEFNFYMDNKGIIHDKTCGCAKNTDDTDTSDTSELLGISKITHTSALHKRCRAFIYIRMIAGSKNTEKYFHWFKLYSTDTVDLRTLALDCNAKCQLRDNRMFIDTKQDRWIIETNISKKPIEGKLYHCNYTRNGDKKTFNSSAYHEQFPYSKSVPSLIHYIAVHSMNC